MADKPLADFAGIAEKLAAMTEEGDHRLGKIVCRADDGTPKAAVVVARGEGTAEVLAAVAAVEAKWDREEDGGAAPPPLTFRYKNYRGVIEDRRVTPTGLVYGSDEYHPAPQWLLLACDHDRKAERTFAVASILWFAGGARRRRGQEARGQGD